MSATPLQDMDQRSHLSDEDIQLYADDDKACAPHILTHMNSCDICRTAAASYRQIFAGIRQSPAPVFDFDLAALVIAQLPDAGFAQADSMASQAPAVFSSPVSADAIAAFEHAAATGSAALQSVAAAATTPVAQPSRSSGIGIIPLIAAILIVSIGTPIYIFRAYILKTYPGILSGAVYLFLLPILAVIIFQTLEVFRKYQRQMKTLNYS